MSGLTERKLNLAKRILEKYREELYSQSEFRCMGLEQELKRCWGVGYQDLKGPMADLSKTARYRYLAAYYMENRDTGVVVSEFKQPLAELYDIERYHADDQEEKREAFWSKFRTEQRNDKKG